MNLQQQYMVAQERAERFVRANRLEPLWPGQAALDVTAMCTDIFEKGLTPEEQAHRAALRMEWIAQISSPPLDGIEFGFREVKSRF